MGSLEEPEKLDLKPTSTAYFFCVRGDPIAGALNRKIHMIYRAYSLSIRLMFGSRLSSNMRSLAFSKYDVALFIDEKGKTRWSHLLKEFVENGSDRHISRQKLSDYLKELCAGGLVKKTVDRKALMLRVVWRVYPIYVVPESRKKRIEEIRKRKKIYEFVDSASPEKIQKLDAAIRNLEGD